MMKYFILLAIVGLTAALDDGSSQILLEHSFGNDGKFTTRGHIQVVKLPNGEQLTEYIGGRWSEQDSHLLLDAAQRGDWYRIRAPSRIGAESIVGDAFVTSFVPACSLLKSGLNDNLNVAIDSGRQRLLSITVFPITDYKVDVSDCRSVSLSDVGDNFNSTIRLVDVVDGPMPDTQAYLQKVEKEKQERQRGEQGDNRSFLSKYWMYIIPVAVLLMISSAMNPEAQAGR